MILGPLLRGLFDTMCDCFLKTANVRIIYENTIQSRCPEGSGIHDFCYFLVYGFWMGLGIVFVMDCCSILGPLWLLKSLKTDLKIERIVETILDAIFDDFALNWRHIGVGSGQPCAFRRADPSECAFRPKIDQNRIQNRFETAIDL